MEVRNLIRLCLIDLKGPVEAYVRGWQVLEGVVVLVFPSGDLAL